ncbi:uracil-DNA glycosylase [Afifella sp. IM 167]|uniref:uracil-DNA glycosylase n=1 Tax=Afifella sp. IM 167 TaxID=2033586 RepID=UPI001CC9A0F3|nr:uracil-DNA glycosylase [Afifella sp. IM 167]MBZ8131896.1 uracil-DNA glycosylase [Afifella sp. IM 167]
MPARSAARPAATTTEPSADCPLCPRLAAFRQEWREKEPAWHNAPVPTFGAGDAPLLIVGLAPGLRGANRTGRPFTGDFAGDLLYATLIEYGFARGEYRADPEDGLTLTGAAITNAVRCVPPQNKPVGAEIATCRPFLSATIDANPKIAAVLALGRIAHDSVLRALGVRLRDAPFGHGAVHELDGLRLYDSYHCSRYNTNTGVLTEAMFRSVFARIREDIGCT